MNIDFRAILLSGFFIFALAFCVNAQDTIFVRNNIRYIASELKIGNKAISFKEAGLQTSEFLSLKIKWVDSIVYSDNTVNHLRYSNPRYYRPLGFHGGLVFIPIENWFTYTIGVNYFASPRFVVMLEAGKSNLQDTYFSTGFRIHTSGLASQSRLSGLIGVQLLRVENDGGILFPAGINYSGRRGLMGELAIMISLPFISGISIIPVNFKLGYNIRSNKRSLTNHRKNN